MRKQLYRGAILVAAPMLLAASAAPLTFQPGSRVWVEGTSSVRSYRCETTQVTGTAAANTVAIAELGSVARAEISLPVSSLDCRNGTMNGHMRNALKAAENPTIRFRASSVTVTPTGDAAGTATMRGELTIAGNTQPVTLEGAVASENGQLRVRGTERLTMTDYGVRPPSLMMGTMKVHPPVTVGFDVLLKP